MKDIWKFLATLISSVGKKLSDTQLSPVGSKGQLKGT